MDNATTLNIAHMMEHADELDDHKREQLKEYLYSIADTRDLTPQEKIALFRVTIDRTSQIGIVSDRREDWYGDDGR